jgi:hypothetical protein
VHFTLGSLPISELIGFGDTAYRGIETPFQSPAQNTPPAVRGNFRLTSLKYDYYEKYDSVNNYFDLNDFLRDK